jgi:hypothetical protein
MKTIGVALLCLVMGACGGGGSSDGDMTDADTTDADTTDSDTTDADTTDDAPPPDGMPPGDWQQLIGRDWSIPPGSADTYKCVRIRIEEDIWVAGFRAIAPLGTHHTVVTIANGGTLGEYDCSVGNLDSQMLYASGVGTDDLLFPEGVAMRLTAGMTINLNLHLFNASDNELTGTSGIMIKTLQPAAVVHEADMVFAGTQRINVPSNGIPTTITGGCTAPREWNVFTAWPHMHQFATHSKLTIGGDIVLDTPYDFNEQVNYPEVARVIPQGTAIRVDCTYVNNSGVEVTFGDSSNQEMCFTGMYKWPAGGGLFACVTQP